MPPSGNPNPPKRKPLMAAMERMEPETADVLIQKSASSIAISLKRIADNTDRLYFQMERLNEMLSNIEMNVRANR